MYRIFLVFTALSFLCIKNSIAQGGIDEEIGFKFVKGEYLFDTGRFEDCIIEYNQVIANNPSYKNALIKRAMAKYALAAYKGAKLDAIQFIELKGINAEVAAILGKIESSMGNDDAAINSLTASISLDPSESSIFELRAGLFEKNQMLLKACQDYEAAAKLGSAMSLQKVKMLCGGSNVTKTPRTNPQIPEKPKDTVYTPPLSEGQAPTNADDSLNSPTKSDDTEVEQDESEEEQEVDDPTIPKEDNFKSTIVIDDELTIEYYGQELGRRKITETPSILILADEDGTVCVDVCVNSNGKVLKAEFNPRLSSIAKKSLVSLAIRKAQEFTFEKSMYNSQCGYMVFKIKVN